MVRSSKLSGATYKLRWPDSEHAMYVTINDVEQDGVARPFEIFVNSKNLEHYAWVVALTRMISAVFRRGGEVAFVAEELKQVFDPRGGQWQAGSYVPSLVAAIGDIIERHMVETGFLTPAAAPVTKAAGAVAAQLGPLCPKMQPARPGARGGLPELPALRLVEMRMNHATSAQRESIWQDCDVSREKAANPMLVEYEARRCRVCQCRYPSFGFGPPLTKQGHILWACFSHQSEVHRMLTGVPRTQDPEAQSRLL